MLNKAFKNKKGITLIALIITIIVLLILAGVAIAMLGGNNGTPAKANEAAAKDAVAAAKDRINLVASDALLDFYKLTYVNDTSIGSTDVKEQAQTAVWNKVKAESNYEGVTLTPNDTKKTITVTSTKDTSVSATCTVKQGGGITWSDWKVAGEEGVKIKVNGETKTVTEANAKDFYGTTVKTINVNGQNVEFGLFYIDFAGTYSGGEEGTVYLRAKSSIGYTKLNGGITNTTDQAAAIEIMKKINPQWKTARGETTAYSNFTSAEKGAAYLCNPNNATWSGIGSTFGDDLNYVIGGPSVELFLASYNAKYPVTTPSSTTPEYSAHFNLNGNLNSSWMNPGYLYGKKESANGTLAYNFNFTSAVKKGDTTVGGMYGVSTFEWLASPLSYEDDRHVCIAVGDIGMSGQKWSSEWGLGPLVSLKSEVDLSVTN